jgi:hypothetical protein
MIWPIECYGTWPAGSTTGTLEMTLLIFLASATFSTMASRSLGRTGCFSKAKVNFASGSTDLH